MKNINLHILAIALLVSLPITGCKEDWDDHYLPNEPTVNLHIWDQIKQNSSFSSFVGYMEMTFLDSIFETNQEYTLFIPNNQAFDSAPDTVEVNAFIMNHLVSANVFNIRNVEYFRKLQTRSGKFAFIEHNQGEYSFDGKKIVTSSPLYLDGKYYELDELPLAKPNFYEYFSTSLTVMKDYVDSQDSVYLDRAISTPVGFNENGDIVYDSVFTVKNLFESYYFPVSQESREEFATFILFTQDQYESALNEMAQAFGGDFKTYEDIPRAWQDRVLFPDMLENGVFQDMLTLEQLADPNLINISGDFINLDMGNIDSVSQVLCSNGVIYHYGDFHIPEELYLGEVKIEGESLIDSVGQGKYAWKDNVTVLGANIEPAESKTELASGGSMVTVVLGRNFSDSYSVEFSFQDIFPGRHRLEWRANYRPSAAYNIYINDEQVGQFDMYNFRYSIPSVTGERYAPENGFNRVDFIVENLTEYGDVRVKFEFLEGGISSDNGFNIDYVSLIPWTEN